MTKFEKETNHNLDDSTYNRTPTQIRKLALKPKSLIKIHLGMELKDSNAHNPQLRRNEYDNYKQC